jgi:hypothetical protein
MSSRQRALGRPDRVPDPGVGVGCAWRVRPPPVPDGSPRRRLAAPSAGCAPTTGSPPWGCLDWAVRFSPGKKPRPIGFRALRDDRVRLVACGHAHRMGAGPSGPVMPWWSTPPAVPGSRVTAQAGRGRGPPLVLAPRGEPFAGLGNRGSACPQACGGRGWRPPTRRPWPGRWGKRSRTESAFSLPTPGRSFPESRKFWTLKRTGLRPARLGGGRGRAGPAVGLPPRAGRRGGHP